MEGVRGGVLGGVERGVVGVWGVSGLHVGMRKREDIEKERKREGEKERRREGRITLLKFLIKGECVFFQSMVRSSQSLLYLVMKEIKEKEKE